MSRHYSKIFVELPDGPSDPDIAIITIECETCGTKRIQVNPVHLGSLARVLADTIKSVDDDGVSEALATWIPSTPDNKEKVRRYLDERFPGWKAERQAQRQ